MILALGENLGMRTVAEGIEAPSRAGRCGRACARRRALFLESPSPLRIPARVLAASHNPTPTRGLVRHSSAHPEVAGRHLKDSRSTHALDSTRSHLRPPLEAAGSHHTVAIIAHQRHLPVCDRSSLSPQPSRPSPGRCSSLSRGADECRPASRQPPRPRDFVGLSGSLTSPTTGVHLRPHQLPCRRPERRGVRYPAMERH